MYRKTRLKLMKKNSPLNKKSLVSVNTHPQRNTLTRIDKSTHINDWNAIAASEKDITSRSDDLTSSFNSSSFFNQPAAVVVKTYGKQKLQVHSAKEPARLATLRIINESKIHSIPSDESNDVNQTLHYDSCVLENTFDRLVREDKKFENLQMDLSQSKNEEKNAVLNDLRVNLVKMDFSQVKEEPKLHRYPTRNMKNLKRKNVSSINTSKSKKKKLTHNSKKMNHNQKKSLKIKKQVVRRRRKNKLSKNNISQNSSFNDDILNSSKKILRSLLPRTYIIPEKYFSNVTDLYVEDKDKSNSDNGHVLNDPRQNGECEKLKRNRDSFNNTRSLSKKLNIKPCRVVLQNCDDILKQNEMSVPSNSLQTLLKPCSIIMPRLVDSGSSVWNDSFPRSASSSLSDISVVESSVIETKRNKRYILQKSLVLNKCSVQLSRLNSISVTSRLQNSLKSSTWACSTPINNRVKRRMSKDFSPVFSSSFKKNESSLVNSIQKMSSFEKEAPKMSTGIFNTTHSIPRIEVFNTKMSRSQKRNNETTYINEGNNDELGEGKNLGHRSVQSYMNSSNDSLHSAETLIIEEIKKKRSLLKALGLNSKHDLTHSLNEHVVDSLEQNNKSPMTTIPIDVIEFLNNTTEKDKRNSVTNSQSVNNVSSLNLTNDILGEMPTTNYIKSNASEKNTSSSPILSRKTNSLTDTDSQIISPTRKSILKKRNKEPFVLLSRLKDNIRINTRSNKCVKWNLSNITEQMTERRYESRTSAVINSSSNSSIDPLLINSSSSMSKENSVNGLQKQCMYLKPGKYWARSLSILHHFQNEEDFEKMSQGKGKRWTQSVRSILNMQNMDTSSNSVGYNQNDKVTQTFNIMENSEKSITEKQSQKSLQALRMSTVKCRSSIRVVSETKNFDYDEDTSFLQAYGIQPRVSSKIGSKRSTLLPTLRGSTIHTVTSDNIVCETVLSPRDIVLQKCGQIDYLSFQSCYSDTYLKRCRKIGEGLYGEVFLYEYKNEKSVLKVIPIEGDKLVNGEPQKKFSEILSEIVIAKELHNLRSNKSYNTDRFVEVKSVKCVKGKYPKILIRLWNDYNDEKESDNDCPTIFDDDQLYIVFELGHGGQDLEAFVFQNASEALAIFTQIAMTLAVAEKSLEFEHRDLHWGNVLISPTSDTEVHYKIDGEYFNCSTNGVKITIIDYTLSRMWYQGCCIFNDLSVDPTLFIAQGEYQFEIYRLMRDKTGNDWQRFEPYTNVLWLHYILFQLLTATKYKKPKSNLHKNMILKLQKLKNSILDYNSAHDFVINCSTF